MDYAKHYQTKATPQSEPIPSKPMVENSAGGYSFAVDHWTRLDRFLILGAEGGTYYAAEQKLVRENAQAIEKCLAEDGPRTVNQIVEISAHGRAPKNDPAIFALAMALKLGDDPTRAVAAKAVPLVCRTGTHLFQLAGAVQAFGGWGRGTKRAFAHWYMSKETDALAYQLVKYQERNGWRHRDVLRLCHPKAEGQKDALFHWAVNGSWKTMPKFTEAPNPVPLFLEGFLKAHETGANVPALIRQYRLTREMVPTEALAEAATWAALLETESALPLTALIRNLGNMSKVGLLTQMSGATRTVIKRLADDEELKRARIHPIGVLAALKTYGQGRGMRGSGVWDAVPQVIDALDAAFYASFQHVEPSGKRLLLAIDISGSMDRNKINGMPFLDAREGSAAMALVTAAAEPTHAFVGFTAALGDYRNTSLTSIPISPRQRLDDVCHQFRQLPMGGTDCSLPMTWALEKKLAIDTFVIYTDSETWAGKIHPAQALAKYRRTMGIPAKLIVVGMCSNGFSIADPTDAGMMDVVGFDTAAPSVISDFARQF